MSLDMDLLIAELRRDEGERLKPYTDTVGKLTIGVGRNLDDVGISEEESAFLLANDLKRTMAEMDHRMAWWRQLDPVRQRVLLNMAFNLGVSGLMGFKNTLKAVLERRWDAAADGMAASKWHRQVGARAVRLERMMRTGQA